MNKKEYNTSLKKTQYEYLSSIKIAKLVAKGMTFKQIYHKCVDELVIPNQSVERRKGITNVLYERVRCLDSFLLNIFINGSLTTSKYLLVYAIAKTDKLFYEFLFDLYRESLIGDNHYISLADFEGFFNSAKERSNDVKQWKDKSINDLRMAYKNVLINSGLAKKDGSNIIPIKIVIPEDIVKHLNTLGDNTFVKATLGV